MKPKRIILVRHGQSIGNVDRKIYKSTPDNKIQLTDRGKTQAKDAGKKIRKLIGRESACFYVSPYLRTRETSEIIQEELICGRIDVKEEPRIREQEWMNPAMNRVFGEGFMEIMSAERDEYGTFFYRIPGGESGADVYDRISTFFETMNRDFQKANFPNNVVLVTHGLTLRIFLMRWFHWTVEEYEELCNPENCQVIWMKKGRQDKYELKSRLKKYKD